MDINEFKEKIRNFTVEEVKAVGSRVEDISPRVFYRLDSLRYNLGVPIKITSLDQGVHVDGSYHNYGLAVDYRLLKYVPKNKVLQVMLDCGFRGIGVYHGFYHADVRDEYALWKRVNGIYLPLI